MKKLLVLFLASGFVIASAAQGAPTARSADLSMVITISGLPGVTLSGAGQSVQVSSTAGSLALAAGQLAQTQNSVIPVTSTTSIASIVAGTLSPKGGPAIPIANLSGTFVPSFVATTPTTEALCPGAPGLGIGCVAGGTGLGGQMALTGTVFVVITPGLVTVPIQLNPAKLGIGGTATFGGGQFAFDAAPWTQGVGKVGYLSTTTTTTAVVVPAFVTFTMMNVMTTTVTQSTTGGGGNVSAPATGTITLVTPTYVSALGNLLPVFSILNLHFIPEPGTLLLLGAGIGGLVLVGRRRR